MNRIVALIVAAVALLFAGSSTLVVVDQRHVALVYSRGGANPTVVGPGLHFKLPTPLQSAVRVDTRVQTLESTGAERYTTSDKATLLVTPLLKYRIIDARELFNRTGGDLQSTGDRLSAVVRDALGNALEKRALADALAHQAEITASAREAMAPATNALGIEVVDLQLARVDLPAEAADAVYKRMSAATAQAASEVRAQGSAQAQEIRDAADRQRQAVLADAYAKAQALKGEGDAKAAEIAAGAFSRDPGFYQFYQSLQAYRAVFKPNDVIVVDADNAFFRFMRGPQGGADPGARTAAAPKKH
ncbi:protease modulator HflC [Trinickia caryophylli]|uniref:Protein HflC n=1 Tax=Trinickia caryophylli TaxID=28094 RepID=A0A1X7FXH4_TRICW|nr:protease modulator HflC [Trinickia caryophylli]PMS11711.1 protease modulator HflC [Trinickia caryophylli]TRX17389.1 protease modulator HflC [Trinickia caryophylli]WQE11869.1 protease modulator HflC [Trinickia caryophylli]SMF60557.1 protease FtsH subunit HflC [Trinickia caryophylli]GLU34627.1 protein HflC [Trinickia caryophylli]